MSAQIKNLLGKKFGRLKVVAITDERTSKGEVIWKCLCKCNRNILVSGCRLQNGNVKSCGCLQKETRVKNGRESKVHGQNPRKNGKNYPTPEYNTWKQMKQRCFNPNATSYPYYGALGITVCEAWKNSFVTFFADMGKRPKGKTLDRIDPNGNYEPGNCRWANPYVQVMNRRGKIYLYIE